MAAEEWVNLMSCCSSILEMGLEREGWDGMDSQILFYFVIRYPARNCLRFFTRVAKK